MTLLTSSRSQQFTESVIRNMTRHAIAHNAVNLAQGFPDFEPPKEMLEAAIKAIRDGKNQYPDPRGIASLRQAIAKKIAWYQGIEVDPDQEISVACGSTEAMIAALLAVIDTGDETIVFEPFYENYGPDTILCNATPRYVQMKALSATQNAKGEAWTVDPEELTAAFNNKTKAIIINTPNNPTGRIFKREELELIAKLCEKWNVIAITDEIYEHMLYDGEKHVSMATLPGMWDRTITINAISKTYSATGWRIGWSVAPAHLSSGIRKVHDFLTVAAPHPLQEGAATALGLPRSYYEEMCADYGKRRDFFLPALIEAGFACWKPFGAYYVMADFSGVKAWKEGKFQDDTEFAMWLVKDIGVAAVPGSSFYREPQLGRTKLRFSFGRKMEMLKDAAARLKKLR